MCNSSDEKLLVCFFFIFSGWITMSFHEFDFYFLFLNGRFHVFVDFQFLFILFILSLTETDSLLYCWGFFCLFVCLVFLLPPLQCLTGTPSPRDASATPISSPQVIKKWCAWKNSDSFFSFFFFYPFCSKSLKGMKVMSNIMVLMGMVSLIRIPVSLRTRNKFSKKKKRA